MTVGGAEANQLVCQTLLEPGDVCIVMEPGYRQVWDLAMNLGAVLRPFSLRPIATGGPTSTSSNGQFH